jgi:hypothetical protein
MNSNKNNEINNEVNTKDNLLKMKLIDIKKIADSKNICLTKNNGKGTKNKTKEELINEICII